MVLLVRAVGQSDKSDACGVGQGQSAEGASCDLLTNKPSWTEINGMDTCGIGEGQSAEGESRDSLTNEAGGQRWQQPGGWVVRWAGGRVGED